MKKILAIGNSFSQDATALIEFLTDGLYVRNLCIGGCSLEQHCKLLEDSRAEYQYQHNGERCIPEALDLASALKMQDWDFVTLQQVSGLSGELGSYYPYIIALIGYIKEHTRAQIVFNQTWAYEKGSSHPDFARYDGNSDKMRQSIKSASLAVCQREGLNMICTGELIARLRGYDFFNTEKGGVSLCRDGFHLSFGYGRFAAASAWIKFFTGKIPSYLLKSDLTGGYELIKKELLNNSSFF